MTRAWTRMLSSAAHRWAIIPCSSAKLLPHGNLTGNFTELYFQGRLHGFVHYAKKQLEEKREVVVNGRFSKTDRKLSLNLI